jgi:hypothetical protein
MSQNGYLLLFIYRLLFRFLNGNSTIVSNTRSISLLKRVSKFFNLSSMIINLSSLNISLILLRMICGNLVPLRPIWLPKLSQFYAQFILEVKLTKFWFICLMLFTYFLIHCFFVYSVVLDFFLLMLISFIAVWPIHTPLFVSLTPFVLLILLSKEFHKDPHKDRCYFIFLSMIQGDSFAIPSFFCRWSKICYGNKNIDDCNLCNVIYVDSFQNWCLVNGTKLSSFLRIH